MIAGKPGCIRLDPQFRQYFKGPAAILRDAEAWGPVELYRGGNRLLDGLDGPGGLEAEGLRRLGPYLHMIMGMAPYLVSAARDIPQELGMVFRYPAQREKRGLDASGVEQVEEPLRILTDPGFQGRPLRLVGRDLRIPEMEPLLMFDGKYRCFETVPLQI